MLDTGKYSWRCLIVHSQRVTHNNSVFHASAGRLVWGLNGPSSTSHQTASRESVRISSTFIDLTSHHLPTCVSASSRSRNLSILFNPSSHDAGVRNGYANPADLMCMHSNHGEVSPRPRPPLLLRPLPLSPTRRNHSTSPLQSSTSTPLLMSDTCTP
jgi:hypothetical protein